MIEAYCLKCRKGKGYGYSRLTQVNIPWLEGNGDGEGSNCIN